LSGGLVTTMEVKTILKTFGAPDARSMGTSLAIHVVVVMLIPAQMLLRSETPNKELDIVFYRPPEIPVKPRTVSLAATGATNDAGSPPGAPAPAVKPKPNAPADPDRRGPAELPPGPAVGFSVDPKPTAKVGTSGILAFKDKIASLAQDTVVVPLGADARQRRCRWSRHGRRR
jgi:hypothetical protein